MPGPPVGRCSTQPATAPPWRKKASRSGLRNGGRIGTSTVGGRAGAAQAARRPARGPRAEGVGTEAAARSAQPAKVPPHDALGARRGEEPRIAGRGWCRATAQPERAHNRNLAAQRTWVRLCELVGNPPAAGARLILISISARFHIISCSFCLGDMYLSTAWFNLISK
jgi:hypothetical protein